MAAGGAAAQPAAGPSFDCTKARSVPEKLICSDPQLAQMDRELALLYQVARSAAADPKAFQEEARREWRVREETCKDRGCLVQWFEKRKLQLAGVTPAGPLADRPRAAAGAGMAYLEIVVKDAIDLKDGTYLAKESFGQGRYALISHARGRFEGSDIAQAACSDGYLVSQLPARFAAVKRTLKPDDFVLTRCVEDTAALQPGGTARRGPAAGAPVASGAVRRGGDRTWYHVEQSCRSLRDELLSLGAKDLPPEVTPQLLEAGIRRDAPDLEVALTYFGDDQPAVMFVGKRGWRKDLFAPAATYGLTQYTFVMGREACMVARQRVGTR